MTQDAEPGALRADAEPTECPGIDAGRPAAAPERGFTLSTGPLRSAEDLIHLVLESDGAGAWRVDLAHHRCAVDERLKALLGFDRSAPSEMPLDEIDRRIHPDDIAGVRAARARARAGARFYAEFRTRDRDGAERSLVGVGDYLKPDASGASTHSAGVVFDITDLRRADAALRESEQRFRATFEHAPVGIAHLAPDGRWLRVNPRLCQITGYTEAELLARNYRNEARAGDLAGDLAEADLALAGGAEQHRVEKRYRRKDGSVVRVHLTVNCVRRPDGAIDYFIAIAEDITERREAEKARDLLIGEMNHRVKNSLAIVQALAHQTFLGAADTRQATRAFSGRLAALSAAHDLLTRGSWEKADIAVLAATVLAPADLRARVRLDGPSAIVGPTRAVTIAMALHELFTNAVKYGALSNDSGTIDVSWHMADAAAGLLALEWRERGGPPVSPPQARGFGSTMIEQALVQDTGGRVTMDFRPEGLICRIEGIPVGTGDDGGNEGSQA